MMNLDPQLTGPANPGTPQSHIIGQTNQIHTSMHEQTSMNGMMLGEEPIPGLSPLDDDDEAAVAAEVDARERLPSEETDISHQDPNSAVQADGPSEPPPEPPLPTTSDQPLSRAGPVRRTRSTRMARTNAVKKQYRSFGVQTGIEELGEPIGGGPQLPSAMQHHHYPPFPLVLGLAQAAAAASAMSSVDPPSIPVESCKKLRDHGVDPNWLIKPDLGQPCHWGPNNCSTVRIDWRPGDWERHLQTHLPDPLRAYWACPGCSKTFNRKDSFKRHLKRPETTCSARVDVTENNEWETIFYHEPLQLHL